MEICELADVKLLSSQCSLESPLARHLQNGQAQCSIALKLLVKTNLRPSGVRSRPMLEGGLFLEERCASGLFTDG